MAEFVILKHILPDQSYHWDLMLEMEEKLATWQVPQEPSQWSSEPILSERIFDHRKKYLDYEGPINENRGHVIQVAKGNLELIEKTDQLWRCNLMSELISGELLLKWIKHGQWQLTINS